MADASDYGPAFQASVLRALGSDRDLFALAKPVLRESDFDSVPARFVYEVMRSHHDKYGVLPSCDTFQDEMTAAVDAALSGMDGAPYTEIDESDVPGIASVVDTVSWGLCNPSDRDTPYWKDQLKGFIAAARLAAIPGDELSALRQVEEVEKVNRALSDLDSAAGARLVHGEDEDLFSDENGDGRERIGTGVWGIDRRTAGGGLTKGELGLVVAPSGFGKALVNSDRIPTPDGWRTVGEIRAGDMLFDHNGKPVKVLAVHPQTGKRPVWVVTFKDGRKVRCCADHNWEYWSKSHRDFTPKVKTTKEMFRIMARHGGNTGGDGRLFKVRNARPAEYPEKALPVDPYVLGAFLGNGCGREKHFSISSGSSFVPEKLAGLLGAKAHKYTDRNFTYMFKREDGSLVQTKDVMLGCCKGLVGKYSGDKFIPDDYLTGSVEQRLRLLNGLLDTDGYVTRTRGKVSFSTTSPRLKDTFMELCHSLGFESSACRENRTDYRTGECYVISVQCDEKWKSRLFTLPEKAGRVSAWSSNGKRKHGKEFTSIESIEPTDELAEMTCFTVASREGLFLCGDYVVTHNTTVMINFGANMAMLGYYTLFVSLEMPYKDIFKRYTAIIGNFDATYLHMKPQQWPKDALKRARLVASKKSPFYGMFTILDGTGETYTVQMVESAIEGWRRGLLEAGVPENRIAAVFVDYLGKMTANGLPGITKNSGVYDQERKIMDAFDGVSTRQNVILWTATQTNREGFGRAQQSMKNISNSIGAVFPTYLAIGLGAPRDEADAEPQYEFEVETRDPRKGPNALTRCDRKMVITIMKSRNSQTEGQFFTVYQGPTLRLWTNRQQAQTAMEVADRMSMDELYSLLKPPRQDQ